MKTSLKKIKTIISKVVSNYDNWEIKDNNFLKNGKIIFSLDNYESGFDYIKHGVIWMAQDNLDEITDKGELGSIIMALPKSNWTIIKGVYDGISWKRKYPKYAY